MTRYSTTDTITPEQFVDLLHRAGFSDRRPVDDRECIAGMLEHANLLVTAWIGSQLVGLARAVTDFVYCCYLSDLAVDESFQRRGIGRGLIRETSRKLGPRRTINLLAAPGAADYYPRIGFSSHPSAWVLSMQEAI